MEQQITHRLVMGDFARMELGGVKEVMGFDETQIELSLGDAVLLIGGKELKIENFSREKSEIVVTGKIDSLFREEEGVRVAEKSFFRRIFS